MKHHITSQQAKEVTQEQLYSLFAKDVSVTLDAYVYTEINSAKMIEIIDEVTIAKSMDGKFHVITLDESHFSAIELVDALWEATKDYLQKA
jgi:hypothetical protein